MPVLMLPEPEGWLSGRRTLSWAVVGVLAISGWLIYCGVAATTRGHYLMTVVVLCWLAPVVGALAVLIMSASNVIRMRTNTDSLGTTLWPNPRATVLLVAGLVTFIPGGVLFVVFAPRGALDLPMSRGMQTFLPIAMGFAVFLAVVGLAAVWRRRGIGFLTLGPAGMEVANVLSTKSIDWQDIDEIRGHSDTKRTRRAVVLSLRDGSEEVVEGLDLCVPRGNGLYWMVRHYWTHPDDRRELSDSRALRRLDEGRFDLT